MHVTMYPMGAGPGLVHPAEAVGHTPVSCQLLSAGRRRRSSLLSSEGMVGGGSSAVPSPEMPLAGLIYLACVVSVRPWAS